MSLRHFVCGTALLALTALGCNQEPVYIDHRNPEFALDRGHYTLTGSLKVKPDTLYLPEGVRPLEGWVFYGVKVGHDRTARSAELMRMRVDEPKNPSGKELAVYEKACVNQHISVLTDAANKYDLTAIELDSTTVVPVQLVAGRHNRNR